MKIGFNNEKYLQMQSSKIMERISQFGDKLYLEFGGKLYDDFHASRVLPGFAPDSKLQMLKQLKDQTEIVLVINSKDILQNKVRADLGITYDQDVLRLIKEFQKAGFYVSSVVITQCEGKKIAESFKAKLKRRKIAVYQHYYIEGYPTNTKHIISEQGFGKNDYIKTTRPLVVVTAPGPGSGKMATCLSQLYHDSKNGIRSGYAKYETFPIWNIGLDNPINLAYEAATVDLKDVNMIDPWHLQSYGESTVNYNRDIEVFPVLNNIFQQLLGTSPYKSPTDMGVNMAGFCISDDEVCREASYQEIIRRYLQALVANRKGADNVAEVEKIKLIMSTHNLKVTDRPVVTSALNYNAKCGVPVASMQLNDGRIVTGRTSDLLGCASSMLLNALKTLADIPDDVKLIAPTAIEPIQKLKTESLGDFTPQLHTDEVLIALSVSAAESKQAQLALQQLPKLRGCQVHSTYILPHVDERIFRKLGINATSEAVYATKRVYYNR